MLANVDVDRLAETDGATPIINAALNHKRRHRHKFRHRGALFRADGSRSGRRCVREGRKFVEARRAIRLDVGGGGLEVHISEHLPCLRFCTTCDNPLSFILVLLLNRTVPGSVAGSEEVLVRLDRAHALRTLAAAAILHIRVRGRLDRLSSICCDRSWGADTIITAIPAPVQVVQHCRHWTDLCGFRVIFQLCLLENTLWHLPLNQNWCRSLFKDGIHSHYLLGLPSVHLGHTEVDICIALIAHTTSPFLLQSVTLLRQIYSLRRAFRANTVSTHSAMVLPLHHAESLVAPHAGRAIPIHNPPYVVIYSLFARNHHSMHILELSRLHLFLLHANKGVCESLERRLRSGDSHVVHVQLAA